MLRISTTVFTLLFFVSALSAKTIYVRQGTDGDGTSWNAAFGQLTFALENATAGDTILMSAGTYLPTTTTDRTATFQLPDNIYLRGGYAPTGTPTFLENDLTLYPTILSGDIGVPDLATDNSYHVVTITTLTASTVINSVTIAHGYANLEGEIDQYGGGIYFQPDTDTQADGLQLMNCSFQDNQAANGGAVYILADSVDVQILMSNCQFMNNVARFGAAIHSEAKTSGNIEFGVHSSNFSSNNGTEGGGAISNSANEGNILFSAVRTGFIENTGVLGGAIFNLVSQANLVADVENCVFSKNIGGDGGAISNFGFEGDPLQLNLRSCTFSGNRSEIGAGVSIYGSNANLQAVNTIFWDNVASDEGNSLSSQFSAITSLQNCLIEEEDCGGISFANTICRDVIFATDPLFQNPAEHNYNLLACSPAVDMGVLTIGETDFADRPRIVGARNDIGAYELQQTERDTIIYVNAKNASPIVDGMSWETAFTDLQSALNVAECGIAKEIWLAAGTYLPAVTEENPTASFQINIPLKIIGQFAGTESNPTERDFTADPTILSGNIGDPMDSTDNAVQLLHIRTSVTLEYITIQDAYATTDGGGIFIEGNDTTMVQINHCRIINNTTQTNGGGLAIESGNLIIEDSYFQGNEAINFGGAFYRSVGTNVAIRNTFWMDNVANSGGAIYQAGGFGNVLLLPLVNCILARNIATINGGAIYNGSANTTLINCTVADNQAQEGGAIYNVSASDLTQTSINTIFNNNQAANEFVFGLQARGRFDHCLLSDFQTCPEGANCEEVLFDQMPLFDNNRMDDYIPLNCSPTQNRAAIEFAPSKDIFNTPRMEQDSLVDIGAVEINFMSSGMDATVMGSTVEGCSAESTGQISIQPSPDWTFPIQIIIASDTTVSDSLPMIIVDNLLAGDYPVEVIDGTGCRYEYEATVEGVENDIFIIVNVLNQASCVGSCDAAINVVANGGAAYTFAWEDGTFGQMRDSLCAGSYELTVTDQNGCSLIRPVEISEPAEPLMIQSTVFNATDENTADGGIEIAVTGGTEEYEYFWDNGIGNVQNPDSLAAGTYQLTVTDANGCTEIATIEVFATGDALIFQSIATIAPTCTGDSTGQIFVNISGGTGDISFNWLPTAADTNVLENLVAGEYSLTVTDELGVQIDTTLLIEDPAPLGVLVDGVQTLNCANECNGVINISIENGVAPFSFTWSNGNTGGISENLCAGVYVVTVTDANGCIAKTDSIEITAPDSLLVEVLTFNDSGVGDGVVVVTANGGMSPYTYLWTDENGVEISTESSVTDLNAGIYCVDVTDAAGCIEMLCDTVRMTTNIVEVENDLDWQIAPVPTQSNLQIDLQFPISTTDWQWQLLDINGRVLRQQKVVKQQFTLNLETLSAGMYYLRLQSDNQLTIRRLVKL